MQRYTIVISGRVQGVFFRQSAKEKAEQFGLAGFACNEPDGTVYIEAEGDPDQLVEFLSWCRQGPNSATVEAVKFSKTPATGYSKFEIL